MGKRGLAKGEGRMERKWIMSEGEKVYLTTYSRALIMKGKVERKGREEGKRGREERTNSTTYIAKGRRKTKNEEGDALVNKGEATIVYICVCIHMYMYMQSEGGREREGEKEGREGTREGERGRERGSEGRRE